MTFRLEFGDRTLGSLAVAQGPHSHPISQRRSRTARNDVHRGALRPQLMRQFLRILLVGKAAQLHRPRVVRRRGGRLLGVGGTRSSCFHGGFGGRFVAFNRRRRRLGSQRRHCGSIRGRAPCRIRRGRVRCSRGRCGELRRCGRGGAWRSGAGIIAGGRGRRCIGSRCSRRFARRQIHRHAACRNGQAQCCSRRRRPLRSRQ